MLNKAFFLQLVSWQICCIFSQINMTVYKQMPALYHFENYDMCLNYNDNINSSNKTGTYCIVYAEIVPNATSKLWQQIQKFSADHKRHFRHDHLFFGVCLERCKNLLHSLTRSHIEMLYGGKVQDTEILAYYANVHKRDSDERTRYDNLIGSCLNNDFQLKYDLKLRTSIEYCVKSDNHLENDFWDIIMYTIFICVGILIIFCSIYDYRLKLKTFSNQQNNCFYKMELKSTVHIILTSFSICRNYYRITSAPRSQIEKDLQFLHTFRVIGVFFVIFGHTLMLFMAVQVENTEFFEQFFYRVETAIIENGAAIIQIFFVMSGFLLGFKFMKKKLITPITSIKDCIKVYLEIFFYRYLRLLPSLALLLLFNATILTRLQNGPFWRHYTEAERTFCREYWWKNVFFINNYLMKESCSHQTWYLAADMQLFELFLIVLILISKYPKLKKLIYGILLVSTFVVTSFITYFLNLKAIYHSTPENYRYMYFRDAETFYKAYIPFYTNIGGYLFGVLSANLYIKILKSNSSSQEQYQRPLKYHILCWLVIPAGFALLFTGGLVMSYDSDSTSILVAIFSGLYRNLWDILCAVAILSMCFKLGWILYDFFCMAFFRPLARISYQSYLWHVVILRLIGGYFRQPIYVNRIHLICIVLVAFLLTNMFAFILALFIEYPIAEVVKIVFKKFKDEKKTRIKTNEISTLDEFQVTK